MWDATYSGPLAFEIKPTHVDLDRPIRFMRAPADHAIRERAVSDEEPFFVHRVVNVHLERLQNRVERLLGTAWQGAFEHVDITAYRAGDDVRLLSLEQDRRVFEQWVVSSVLVDPHHKAGTLMLKRA
jgi:hypothetical protein